MEKPIETGYDRFQNEPYQEKKQTPKSKFDKLKQYLKPGIKITPIEALNMFGIYRLGARIFDLREAGWNIKTEKPSNPKDEYAVYHVISVGE